MKVRSPNLTYIYPSSVGLKRKENRLVAVVTLFGNVVGSEKLGSVSYCGR